MGQDKAWLDFGGEPLLRRVVAMVAQVVERVIVVRSPNQDLPRLPCEVLITCDAVAHQGPLHGLAEGLKLVPAHCAHVFVAPCDVPLLTAALIRFMVMRAEAGRAVVAHIDGRRIPIPAVYPTEIRPLAQSLLQAGQSSLQSLLQAIAVDELSEEKIKIVDHNLSAFRSMNDMGEYEATIAAVPNATDSSKE